MLKALKEFPNQITEAEKIVPSSSKFKNINNILICGMGGSGIIGDIIKDLANIPVFVAKGKIPKFINNNTLVFIISYSGNTKETISMYKKAKRESKKIVIITSNGKLGKIKNSILIPRKFKANQTRLALGYLLFPALKILRNSDIFKYNLNELISTIKKININQTKKIAKKLYRKNIVLYSSEGYDGLLLRWKQNFAENSKQLSVINFFPEIFHNAIECDYKNASVILILEKSNRKINLFKKMFNTTEVRLKGKTKLSRELYGILFGDYVSYFLAKLNKKDPDKIPRIDKIRKER